MKPPIENDETKHLFENVKITNDEIRQFARFTNMEAGQLEQLQKTVFDLSLILLKLHTHEPS